MEAGLVGGVGGGEGGSMIYCGARRALMALNYLFRTADPKAKVVHWFLFLCQSYIFKKYNFYEYHH